MAAKPCDRCCHVCVCERFVPYGETVIRVKFCLNLFSHFREEDLFKVFKNKKNNNNMAAESRN